MEGGMKFAWKTVALGAVLALAAGAGSTLAETGRRSAALEDDMFLGAALAHAQSELELAQMAQQKAHTPALVVYARRIADGRAALWDKLTAAAKASGTSSDGNHTPNIDSFKSLDGEAFERAYVASQLDDQQNNLDFFEFEAQNSEDAGLKELAASALPQLRQDLAAARDIVKDLPFDEATDASQGVMVSPGRR
jgi:putative membrane protein